MKKNVTGNKKVAPKAPAKTKVAAKKATKPAAKATTAPKATVATKKTVNTRIGRNAAAKILKATGGKIFNCTFVDANGNDRNMTAKLKAPVAMTKGGKMPAPKAEIGMLTVYDMFAKNWRTVNLQTLKGTLRTGGKVYNIR